MLSFEEESLRVAKVKSDICSGTDLRWIEMLALVYQFCA
jgi:hypothetical protein